METETSKKNIYFNFGPEESYFLRVGAQHRRYLGFALSDF
jgi:hypothetical protein